MTSQTHDNVQIDGTRYGTIDYPLEQVSQDWHEITLNALPRPQIVEFSTSCRRGYVADWGIEDGKLFLLAAHNEPYMPPNSIDMLAVFGTERVFAEWFTGQIRCPASKMDRSKSSLYIPYYPAWRVFSFNNGVLTADETVSQENLFPDSDDY